MERVEQPNATACGIACVAMLVGKSYDTVLKKAKKLNLYDGFGRRRNYRTCARHLRQLGRAYGLRLGRKVKFDRRIRHKRVKLADFSSYMKGKKPGRHAIVATHRKDDGWHWVVWDGEQCCVLDPRKSPRKRIICPWYYLRVHP